MNAREVGEGELLVAFADVIVGWPNPSTAHIGLLMTDGARVGRGLGRALHTAVVEKLIAVDDTVPDSDTVAFVCTIANGAASPAAT
ncbi:MAG: GNAT family N-acetyltransferase [Ornithinimicrobium sp.]|uniref:GNAT family N-acetyltransferase n=1 Tax=Ornithinimicrobium sp. TaxID=1977084 RepID=UPI0026E0CAB4|nr:GNAT family N-acetyltransferase [Ornithinimicrobium sp.]MDO5739069.1 GNAT family N-acetyltransferase [Ornithinimicrobium sp.]